MADQALLSDLCSICHTNTPKYRCPGCSTRTCSLKCVQRHKDWAQCSGKRDPTSYVKKAQLSTPAGVDHDYNFISSIEQSRDRADERLSGKVNQAEDARSAKLNAPIFRSRLHQARVNVEYAPVGMSRQKINKTRLAKSKRILWTVEWMHEDQSITIGEIFDNVQISQTYGPIYLKRTGTTTQKRKRDEEVPANEDQPDASGRPEQIPTQGQAPAKEAEEGSTLKLEDDRGSPPQADDESLKKQKAKGSVIFPATPIVKGEPEVGEVPSTLPTGSPDERGLYYYLVRPRTSGAQKVLIPLSPTDTFLDCLQNQTILEFPSIQVLSHPYDALPADFITEKDYFARFQKEADEMKLLIAEVDSPKMKAMECESLDSEPGIPNPSALLATLKQDLRG